MPVIVHPAIMKLRNLAGGPSEGATRRERAVHQGGDVSDSSSEGSEHEDDEQDGTEDVYVKIGCIRAALAEAPGITRTLLHTAFATRRGFETSYTWIQILTSMNTEADEVRTGYHESTQEAATEAVGQDCGEMDLRVGLRDAALRRAKKRGREHTTLMLQVECLRLKMPTSDTSVGARQI
ncbi:hypothetical protein CONPUDRAFT_76904 [Coniophora puteana RWD-64-598 SS2]|uniref:Uncharacterized protein n=1 Tax=Coniophora puteana (strain RWD-64-598) TaxID=741705 RepID=A0A5M3MAG6_CONPW|nr:uncharacterized protein CONPUDRAFT_76904 [Coniophora puteana RWD-64-598 SS2]EIW75844.1 hypothetical protein CONPUDRAFT_76904 [Coniophora puteana RWD-64-598 SS2]